MKTPVHRRLAAACALGLPLAGFASAPQADESPGSDSLQTSVSIYLWLPSMQGDLGYEMDGGSGSVDAGDILDALQMAFMGTFETRKGKWSFLTDVIYLDLGADKVSRVELPRGGAIETNVDLQLSGWQIGLYGGYTLYQSDRISTNLMAGARHLTLDADSTLDISGPLPSGLPTKSLSRTARIWDAVVGLRGRVAFGRNWFVPYLADVGTGESDLTWQAMTGLGYQSDWGDVMLAYRHLEWDEGDDGLLQGLSFSGPGVSLRFAF